MRPGKQLFPLKYENINNNNLHIKNNIKYIKLIIRETFGGKRVYINQIMFYEKTAKELNDLIYGNELNNIYKNQKKLIEKYTNMQLNDNFNNIYKNNNNEKNINIINRKTFTKMLRPNSSYKEDLKLYNTQYINKNLYKIKSQGHIKKKNIFKNINKHFLEINDNEVEKNNIYFEEGKIKDLEDKNNIKGKEYIKYGKNNKESIFIYKVNINKKNNNNKKQGNNFIVNNGKRKSIEIKHINNGINSANSDVRNYQKRISYKRQQLETELNNLTSNKNLKRVKSYLNRNNTDFYNSNKNNYLPKNSELLIDNKKNIKQNNINIGKINIIDISNLTNDKNITKNSTTYNYYKNYKQSSDNLFKNQKINIYNNYQIYEERKTSNLNSNYKTLEPPSPKLINNNFINTINFDEQQKLFLDIKEYKNRMNKTYGNINYNNSNTNTNLFNQIKDKNINCNIYPEQNYIKDNLNNKNNSEIIPKEKNINYIENNNNNIISEIKNKTNRDQIKQKLDYLEGNVSEIKKGINSISENLCFFSKQFMINNFKEYIIQICEEIYNENYKNNFLEKNYRKNEKFLENEIDKKIDEKIGNFTNGIFDKYLQPTINKIGKIMEKNIEQIKSKVDIIDNDIYQTNHKGRYKGDLYKTSSRLNNNKFVQKSKIDGQLYI